ncbi:MAG: hypothetical protein ABI904_12000 [Chloroflexota bacterium]
MVKELTEIATNHYQKTFEITYEFWKERNRLFVYLVLTIGVGLLLLLRVPEVSLLLVDAVAKLLGITDANRINQLYKDFPIDVLLSIFVVITFYLMQRLYSTNLSVSRDYLYLGAIEVEIRKHLALPEESILFTREGKFYWGQRTITQTMSKWYYILVIFIVLLPFLILKIIADINSGNFLLVIIDSIIAIMTLVFFAGYARSAINFDIPIFLSLAQKAKTKSTPKK